jgi:hypothetical protein
VDSGCCVYLSLVNSSASYYLRGKALHFMYGFALVGEWHSIDCI